MTNENYKGAMPPHNPQKQKTKRQNIKKQKTTEEEKLSSVDA